MSSRKINVNIPGPRRVAVIGGTFSGNKGAAAMLESTIGNLREHLHGQLNVDIISVYPGLDGGRPLPSGTRLVPAPPAALVFILPLAAAAYAILRRLGLPRGFLRRWPLLDSIVSSDAILDIEGISFVDGRPAALLYNIACSLPGMICGTPVIRLSQAIGPLEGFINRSAARFILKRCRMTFARGPETARRLRKAGIARFSQAADLAFILGESDSGEEVPEASRTGGGPVIGAAPSQVLADSLARSGIDLAGMAAALLDRLVEETGGRAVLIAHSWLGPDRRSRNNDYHICLRVLERMRHREKAVFIDRELSASGLRRVISGFDTFIACRFHAMVSSLCAGVPCVVPAWSHKYREVMDEFGLGRLVLDEQELSADSLASAVLETISDGERIRESIEAALPDVRRSAMSQIEYTARLLESNGIPVKVSGTASRLDRLFYADLFRGAWMGFGADPEIRSGAASGGFVSTLAIDMLREGEIDGLIAARSSVRNGSLSFETVLCRTAEEILDCRTSIYSDFNHAAGIIDILRREKGRFAAVALPCQWTWIGRWLSGGPERAGELVLRIGLWCGHATHRRLIDDFLDAHGVDTGEMERLWYRKGHWGGGMTILMKDGSKRVIPFRTGYGTFQNLYADCMGRCLSCEDHFAHDSDISFGDCWLPEMKKRRIKHSMAVAMTGAGRAAGERLARPGTAFAAEIPPVLAVQAQKRSVIWHTFGTAGREKAAKLFGARVRGSGTYPARWNDVLSGAMVLLSRKAFAGRMRQRLMSLPRPFHYMYMLVMKSFMNF